MITHPDNNEVSFFFVGYEGLRERLGRPVHALLQCTDAKSWSMTEAAAWWEQWAEEVRTCCEGKCTHLEEKRAIMAAAAALRSAA